jgi:sulfur relay (sulfurtransferase) DsrC/TusE family protein
MKDMDLFESHLGILNKSDPNYLTNTWKESSRFFKEIARDGKDISTAIPALKKVYRDSHQVPTMNEASAAIIYYGINVNNFKDIEELIKESQYPSFILSTFREISARNSKLELAVPLLADSYNHARSDVAKTISNILKKAKNPDFILNFVAKRILENKKLSKLFPDLLKELSGTKVNINPIIKNLNLFFKDSDSIKSLDSALIWIVESGVDISPIEESILNLLKKKNPEIQKNFSYYLSVHYLKTDNLNKLQIVLQDKEASIRYGAYRAIIVFRKYEIQNDSNLYSITLDSLFDIDFEIRQLGIHAFQFIKKEFKKLIFNKEIILKLIQTRKTFYKEFILFLYLISETNLEAAKFVISIISVLKNENTKYLEYTCKNILENKFTCFTCLKIPRYKLYYFDSDLPKELYELTPKINSGETYSGKILTCPLCGRKYKYSYEVETEEMTTSTQITVVRLQPIPTGDTSELKRVTKFLAMLKEDLMHPYEIVRENSANDLANYYLLKNQIKDLKKLLIESNDEVTVLGAIRGIAGKNTSIEIVELLESFLNSKNNFIRSESSLELIKFYISKNDLASIKKLLENSDHKFVVSPSIQETYFKFVQEKLNLKELHPTLLNLLNSKEEIVRRFSDYILSKSDQGTYQNYTLLKRLKSKNPKFRSEAAASIERNLENEIDFSFAIPELSKMLKHSTTAYYAIAALKRMVYKEYDITVAIPSIIKELCKENGNSKEELSSTLSIFFQKNESYEKYLHSLSPLLKIKNDSVSYMVYDLFERASKNNIDIRYSRKYIERFLKKRKFNDSLRERAIKLLAYIDSMNENKNQLYLESVQDLPQRKSRDSNLEVINTSLHCSKCNSDQIEKKREINSGNQNLVWCKCISCGNEEFMDPYELD